MVKKIKGFRYDTEKDKDIIEHIEKQPHQANYIWNLVKNDMNKKGDDNNIEYLVRKYVEEMLKEKNIDTNNTKTDITKKDISQLLNLK